MTNYLHLVQACSHGGMVSDRLRSGIVGTGSAGAVHARAVRAAGGIVAAAAGSTADGDGARRLGAGRHEARAADLVTAADVDVVHICTPNHTHARLAERALAAGKHVICEKPLAMDVGEAQRLAALAASAGTVTAVPFVYRFYPMVRDARVRVRCGETGPLRLLHGTYLQDWLSSPADYDWRVDPVLGGASRAFADIGVHWCDLMEFISGHRIIRLSSRLLTAYPERQLNGGMAAVATEDAATVQFETDHGALGSLVISQVSPGHKNRLWFSLDGAAESLSFDQQVPDTLWVGGRERNLSVARGDQPYSVLPAGHPQGYQDSFNAFVGDVYAAIAGARPDGLPTFTDGVRAAVLTSAVLRSAASGRWVDVGAPADHPVTRR
jgi:predicted dehydrogenase